MATIAFVLVAIGGGVWLREMADFGARSSFGVN